MKIRDIIHQLNKNDAFKETVSIDYIAKILNIDLFDSNNTDKITAYYIGNWYSDNQYFGYRIYFYEDQPMAISSKLDSSTEDFEWISEEMYIKVKLYISSFLKNKISIVNLDEDIGDSYKIEYVDQLLKYHHTIPTFNGNPVTIVEFHTNINNKYNKKFSKMVKIKNHLNEELWIELEKLDFPYNIIK